MTNFWMKINMIPTLSDKIFLNIEVREYSGLNLPHHNIVFQHLNFSFNFLKLDNPKNNKILVKNLPKVLLLLKTTARYKYSSKQKTLFH